MQAERAGRRSRRCWTAPTPTCWRRARRRSRSTLPSGFNGFGTPATFAKFNRGLKGKVELYRALPQGNRTKATGTAGFNAAIAAINASFVNPTAAMSRVPPTRSAASAGDLTNPLADANIYLNPSVGDSIEAGDLRKSKISTVDAKTLNNVTGKYKSTVTDPSGALTMPDPDPHQRGAAPAARPG